MLTRKAGMKLFGVLVAAIIALVPGCADKPKNTDPVNAQEKARDRAEFLKRAINEEKRIVEKLDLSFPAIDAEKGLKELELKVNGLKKSDLVREIDLEYGIVRVNFDKWTQMGENEKKAIVGLLSDYRYAKVKAQFVSIKRTQGLGEIAKAGINGYEVYR